MMMTEQSVAGKQTDNDRLKRIAGEAHKTEPLGLSGSIAGRASDQTLEEQLERLAAVNLSSDRSLEPRLSNAMIRLVSALAGVGLLGLIYLLFKLFI